MQVTEDEDKNPKLQKMSTKLAQELHFTSLHFAISFINESKAIQSSQSLIRGQLHTDLFLKTVSVHAATNIIVGHISRRSESCRDNDKITESWGFFFLPLRLLPLARFRGKEFQPVTGQGTVDLAIHHPTS
jgi:hypothetical protein